MKSKYIDFLRKAFNVAKKNIGNKYEHQTLNDKLDGNIKPSLTLNEEEQLHIKSSSRIAVIGAGISGLSTAYFLQQNGIECSVFEASSRVGGRMFSINEWAGKGTTTDLGAEFVCEYHHDLIDLAKQVGVQLYDLRKDDLFHLPPSFFIDGKQRSFDDFVKGLMPAVKQINNDLAQLDFNFSYQQVPPLIQKLDQLNITQYLNQFQLEQWVRKLLEVIFEAEYGMDAQEQSCLNMLCVLKLPEQNDKVFEILGRDYEVLKIKGGAQALAEGVYKYVKHHVFFKHSLTRYDINRKGEYELTFTTKDNKHQIKTFDYIIFTLPFTLLRKIKTNVRYPLHKQDAIDNMGYANNCKTIFCFKEPAWRKTKKSGLFFTDLLAQCGWDSTAEQRVLDKNAATITFFYGGEKAKIFNDLPQKETLKASSIIINKNLEFDFKKYYDQKTTSMLWKDYPYAQCSYTAFRVGEWTKYNGVPQEPFGNIFFAGEHCNIEFQGFMNGAIQSAKEVVTNVIGKLKQPSY